MNKFKKNLKSIIVEELKKALVENELDDLANELFPNQDQRKVGGEAPKASTAARKNADSIKAAAEKKREALTRYEREIRQAQHQRQSEIDRIRANHKKKWESDRIKAKNARKAAATKARKRGLDAGLNAGHRYPPGHAKAGQYVMTDNELLKREAARKANFDLGREGEWSGPEEDRPASARGKNRAIEPDNLARQDFDPMDPKATKAAVQREIERGNFADKWQEEIDKNDPSKNPDGTPKSRTARAVDKAKDIGKGVGRKAGMVWKRIPFVGKVIIAGGITYTLYESIAFAGTPRGDKAAEELKHQSIELLPIVGDIYGVARDVYNDITYCHDWDNWNDPICVRRREIADALWAAKNARDAAERAEMDADIDALAKAAGISDPPPPPSPTCFVEGSLVKTPGGYVAIEKIKKGDEVIVFEPETGKIYPQKVKETTGLQPSKKHLSLHLETGKIINCTHDHRMLADKGFVKAGDITIGSSLRHYENINVFVNRIEEHTEDTKVVTLDVGSYPRTFIVEDCVVHNAKIKIKILKESRQGRRYRPDNENDPTQTMQLPPDEVEVDKAPPEEK